MVSLFRSRPEAAALPPQAVRVVVLGDQHAGKTALSELIVTRKASRPSKSTAGCSVSVALWEPDDGGGGDGGSSGGAGGALWDGGGAAADAAAPGGRGGQTFFVEIWDVSAHPYYEQARPGRGGPGRSLRQRAGALSRAARRWRRATAPPRDRAAAPARRPGPRAAPRPPRPAPARSCAARCTSR
jgi:hypothetical protein